MTVENYTTLVARVGRMRARYLLEDFPEDFRQIVHLIALEVEGKGVPEARAEANHLFGQALAEYDYFRQQDTRKFMARLIYVGLMENLEFIKRDLTCFSPYVELEMCGVAGCPRGGGWADSRFGRLCKGHQSFVAYGRKRGFKDPYKGIEKAKPGRKLKYGERLSANDPAPSHLAADVRG